MLNRHVGDCSGRSGAVEKNCLASKPGRQPPILLRKEMREYSSWFCRQPLGLYWREGKFARKQTPPQIMPWLFLAGENLHPSPHSPTLGRKIHKGSHLSGEWMPCVYSQTPPPPRLALEMLPILGCAALGCVAALRLHFTWISMSRPGMINSHDFVVALTGFESLVPPLTINVDFVYIEPFWASVCLYVEWISECHFVRMIVRVQWYAVGEVTRTFPSR